MVAQSPQLRVLLARNVDRGAKDCSAGARHPVTATRVYLRLMIAVVLLSPMEIDTASAGDCRTVQRENPSRLPRWSQTLPACPLSVSTTLRRQAQATHLSNW